MDNINHMDHSLVTAPYVLLRDGTAICFCSNSSDNKKEMVATFMPLAFRCLFLLSIYAHGFSPAWLTTVSGGSQSRLLSSYSSEDNPFTRTAAPEVPLSSDISQLPDTFSDAIKKAAARTMTCISSGKKRIRIDFDTSIGDQTYTSIKNTIPMAKEFSVILSYEMDLTMTLDEDEDDVKSETETTSSVSSELDVPSTPVKAEQKIVAEIPTVERTMRIFFPDMGQAALARRDWKMGSDVSEVPPCVYTANIKNDDIEVTDKVAIILCPLASEADSVKRIMDSCTASGVPLIMINPDLINMDQGFGYRARNLRKDVLGTFLTSYKLKTMATGALVREWPNGFSVWNEDVSAPDGSGYRLLETYKNEPSREMMNDLYDAANAEEGSAPKGPNPAQSIFGEVVGFFQGMSKL